MSHKPASALEQALSNAQLQVEVGARYFHYKNPTQEYVVVSLVIIEATEEVGVCYQADYEPIRGIIFMRPLSDFLATVTNGGTVTSRFTKI